MSTNREDPYIRNEARLLPAFGIRGLQEQEKRAASSLLAVARAVPELTHALFGPLGAPKGTIRSYVEVEFKTADGTVLRPDGLVIIERGKKSWSALIEIKTGSATLTSDQVNGYLGIAKDQGFDAVVTISNEITSHVTESPVQVDGRRLRSVDLFHLSWWSILTEAVVQDGQPCFGP